VAVGTERVLIKGKWRSVEVRACPVTFRPDVRQIEAARRARGLAARAGVDIGRACRRRHAYRGCIVQRLAKGHAMGAAVTEVSPGEKLTLGLILTLFLPDLKQPFEDREGALAVILLAPLQITGGRSFRCGGR